jgi:hypothetical protein
MKLRLLVVCIVIFVFHGMAAGAAEVAISSASSECLDCHSITHPGIVKGWHNSRHSRITPARAMAVEGLARKVSSTTVPEKLQSTVVGCAECHTLRPDAHADSFEHNGYQVHVVVSPDDCKTCHAEEAGQYEKNLMSFAYNNLAGNALYQMQQRSIIGGLEKTDGNLQATPANDDTRAEACYYCHGTRLKVTGTEIRDTEVAGELEFPVIEGWPNQGVGRLNLDGSRGSCSACHTRHAFDIEMARKPYTCKECHIGPDVPASKVYESSKHGNIFSALNTGWDFKPVPWTIGEDFTAPTCAVCHISLLVNADQEVVVKRTHQINNRLPWRIFGLIYAHPHPLHPDTTRIRNKDGQPLPTDFAGGFAQEFLISEEEMDIRRRSMQAACLNCHGTSWVRGHWRRFENTIQETNAKTLTATRIMEEAWQTGVARGLPDNPFDEAIEKRWSDTWLFYANTIRFASSMGGGGDYGVFAGGRYQLAQAILELNSWPGRKAPGKPSQ